MIQKFRKKPVEIEAIQWTGYNGHQIIKFVGQNLHFSQPPSGYKHSNDDSLELLTIQIPTLEGVMTANQMDWIIKGINGEFYPCKPDIFEKTYEPETPGESNQAHPEGVKEVVDCYNKLVKEYTLLKEQSYSKELLKGYSDAIWDLSVILKDDYGIEVAGMQV